MTEPKPVSARARFIEKFPNLFANPFVEVKNTKSFEKITVDRLLDGKVFILRNLQEIRALRKNILSRVCSQFDQTTADEAENFFNNHKSQKINLFALSKLASSLLVLKNEREVSKIFAPLINSLRLSPVVCVDSGHFRLVFPKHYDEIKNNPELLTNFRGQHQDTVSAVIARENETEPLLVAGESTDHQLGKKLFSRVHRDVDSRHSHLQLNFWFALHDLTKKESLEIYPEFYTSTKPYCRQKEKNSFKFHDYYGKKFQTKLSFGDCLLFHSQVFHETPRENPIQTRLSVELRVGSGSNDSLYHYRRLFVDIRNFAQNEE